MKLNTIEVLRIRLDEEPKKGYAQGMHVGINGIVMFRVNYHSDDEDFYITFMGTLSDIRNDYSHTFLDCDTEEEAIEKCKGIMIDFFHKFTDDEIEFGETKIETYKE